MVPEIKQRLKSAKVLILGSFGVGKTSLRKRFMGEGFSETYLSTIGVDFSNVKIEVGNAIWNLQLWDIAGQLSFIRVTKSFLEYASGVILVFDQTKFETRSELRDWLDKGYYARMGYMANHFEKRTDPTLLVDGFSITRSNDMIAGHQAKLNLAVLVKKKETN